MNKPVTGISFYTPNLFLAPVLLSCLAMTFLFAPCIFAEEKTRELLVFERAVKDMYNYKSFFIEKGYSENDIITEEITGRMFEPMRPFSLVTRDKASYETPLKAMVSWVSAAEAEDVDWQIEAIEPRGRRTVAQTNLTPDPKNYFLYGMGKYEGVYLFFIKAETTLGGTTHNCIRIVQVKDEYRFSRGIRLPEPMKDARLLDVIINNYNSDPVLTSRRVVVTEEKPDTEIVPENFIENNSRFTFARKFDELFAGEQAAFATKGHKPGDNIVVELTGQLFAPALTLEHVSRDAADFDSPLSTAKAFFSALTARDHEWAAETYYSQNEMLARDRINILKQSGTGNEVDSFELHALVVFEEVLIAFVRYNQYSIVNETRMEPPMTINQCYFIKHATSYNGKSGFFIYDGPVMDPAKDPSAEKTREYINIIAPTWQMTGTLSTSNL